MANRLPWLAVGAVMVALVLAGLLKPAGNRPEKRPESNLLQADGYIPVGQDFISNVNITDQGNIAFIRKGTKSDFGAFYYVRAADKSTAEFVHSRYENGAVAEATVSDAWAAWVDVAPDFRWRLEVMAMPDGTPFLVASSEDPGRQRLQFDNPKLALGTDRLYWAEVGESGADIYVVDLRSRQVRPLTTTHRAGIPLVSQNHILFPEFTSDERKAIETVMIDDTTGSRRTIFSPEAKIGALSFAYPDLVFVDRDLQSVELIDVRTGAVRVISDHSTIPDDDFQVAATAGYVAWTHVGDTVVHLYSERDGSHLSVATGFEGVEVMSPSLNGKLLAFVGQKEGEQRLFYKRLP